MKKGLNIMKNGKAANKNIQKKGMKDEKKNALPRLKGKGKVANKSIQKKPALGGLKEKAPPPQKNKKTLIDKSRCRHHRSSSSISCGSMSSSSGSLPGNMLVMKDKEKVKKGPRTPMLKGPLMPEPRMAPYVGQESTRCMLGPRARAYYQTYGVAEYYKTFQLICMFIPEGRLVVGVEPSLPAR